jgi:hypothetical protein
MKETVTVGGILPLLMSAARGAIERGITNVPDLIEEFKTNATNAEKSGGLHPTAAFTARKLADVVGCLPKPAEMPAEGDVAYRAGLLFCLAEFVKGISTYLKHDDAEDAETEAHDTPDEAALDKLLTSLGFTSTKH